MVKRIIINILDTPYRRAFFIYFFIFIFITVLIIQPVGSTAILRLDTSSVPSSKRIEFDDRYTKDSSKSDSFPFTIYNDGNTTMTVSNIVVSSSPGGGISINLPSTPFTISAYSYRTVTVTYTVPNTIEVADGIGSEFSGSIRVDTNAAPPSSQTFDVRFYVIRKIPAKLVIADSFVFPFQFDKPKKSAPSNFVFTYPIEIGNGGDTDMSVTLSTYSNPGNGITINVDYYPSLISARLFGTTRNSKDAKISISVPKDTSEGYYSGMLSINAVGATKYITVGINVIQPVNLTIEPKSIDFGSVDILSDSKTQEVFLSEYWGYKSVNNIQIKLNKFLKNDEERMLSENIWLAINKNQIASIAPGGSDSLLFTLRFGPEAMAWDKFSWTYYVQSNIGLEQISINAKASIFTKCIRELREYENQPNQEIRNLCGNARAILEYADINRLTQEAIDILSLGKATLALIRSHNTATSYINSGNHEAAYSHLISGVVSAKMIRIFADRINIYPIRDQKSRVISLSQDIVDPLVEKERQYFETVGTQTENTNKISAANAYYKLSGLYGILGDTVNEGIYKAKYEKIYKEYSSLVEKAKNDRIQAEEIFQNMKNQYLTEFGTSYYLINPLYYDDALNDISMISNKLNSASDTFSLSGEKMMAEQAQQRLIELNEWGNNLKRFFYIFMIIYIVVFVTILIKISKATVSFVRDTQEMKIGDFLV